MLKNNFFKNKILSLAMLAVGFTSILGSVSKVNAEEMANETTAVVSDLETNKTVTKADDNSDISEVNVTLKNNSNNNMEDTEDVTTNQKKDFYLVFMDYGKDVSKEVFNKEKDIITSTSEKLLVDGGGMSLFNCGNKKLNSVEVSNKDNNIIDYLIASFPVISYYRHYSKEYNYKIIIVSQNDYSTYTTPNPFKVDISQIRNIIKEKLGIDLYTVILNPENPIDSGENKANILDAFKPEDTDPCYFESSIDDINVEDIVKKIASLENNNLSNVEYVEKLSDSFKLVEGSVVVPEGASYSYKPDTKELICKFDTIADIASISYKVETDDTNLTNEDNGKEFNLSKESYLKYTTKKSDIKEDYDNIKLSVKVNKKINKKEVEPIASKEESGEVAADEANVIKEAVVDVKDPVALEASKLVVEENKAAVNTGDNNGKKIVVLSVIMVLILVGAVVSFIIERKRNHQ